MIGKPGRMLARPGMVGVDFTDLDGDYLALLAEAIDLEYAVPSPKQQLAGSSLIAALKAAGVWAKLDVFYVFAQNGSQEFATLNWKDPANLPATLVNAPTFTANAGFVSDGATSYLSTTYNPSTFGGQRVLDSGSVTAWTIGMPTTGAPGIAGAVSANNDGIVVTSGVSTLLPRLHNGNASLAVGAVANIPGFQQINRTNSTTLTIYTGDGVQQSRTQNSTAITNAAMSMLRRGTSYTSPSVTLAHVSSGASLDVEAAAYLAAFAAYLGAL